MIKKIQPAWVEFFLFTRSAEIELLFLGLIKNDFLLAAEVSTYYQNTSMWQFSHVYQRKFSILCVKSGDLWALLACELEAFFFYFSKLLILRQYILAFVYQR